jgi:glutamate--cysteine ligase
MSTLPQNFASAEGLEALARQPEGLRGLARGIEKESLRVAADGSLSTLPHPPGLGSPLTHPSITTDFSESQLELITGVHDTPEACLGELNHVHRFVYRQIGEELLWPSSMPCIVGPDAEIPIGRYGSSNVGLSKHVYRRGLGLRYGRLMQTISGIHYNFSLPEAAWKSLGITTQDEQTAAYFGLIRNFRRWSWLLIYLFGASPAVCRSFTKNMQHNLQALDEGSMYLPYATSLRMGPLGYQSTAQSSLHISYNSLRQYADSMVEALTEKFPAYEAYGVKDAEGNYQQLNTTVLQIENEFYGTIRPKRRTLPGERPVTALRARGVEYVEVRCLDLNPYLPVGIDAPQIRFLDTFLLLCLLADSPPDSEAESNRMARNQVAVVEKGRDPELALEVDEQGNTIALHEWANHLLKACRPIADLLDDVHAVEDYTTTLTSQFELVEHPNQTPSARVLQDMQQQAIPFFRFSMNKAIAHKQDFLNQPLDAAELALCVAQVRDSIARQREMEAADVLSFSEYLQDFLAIP